MKKLSSFSASCCSIILFFLVAEIILRVHSFTYFPFTSDTSENHFNWLRPFRHSGGVLGVDSTMTNYIELPGVMRSQKIEPKQSGTLRIAIMGESSVYNLGKSTLMKNQLEKSFQKPVEIVNIGLLAQNSHALKYVLDQAIGLSIDMYIMYIGHNEFLQTYLYTYNNSLTKLSQDLVRRSRVAQLVLLESQKLQEHLYNSETIRNAKIFRSAAKLLPESVNSGHRYSEHEKSIVYEQYRDNLRTMIDVISASHGKVIISTVAYNRREEPWSPHGKSSTFTKDFNVCEGIYEAHQYQQAKTCYEKVVEQDDIPVRSNNTVNAIIRSIAVEKNIPLVDADQVIVQASSYDIPGDDLFVDHCHLNSKGNDILLSEFTKAVLEHY